MRLVRLLGSEWSRDGGRLLTAAVLAGVELVSLDFTQVRSAQTGVGRDRDSGCYKRRITPGPSDNVYRKLTDCDACNYR